MIKGKERLFYLITRLLYLEFISPGLGMKKVERNYLRIGVRYVDFFYSSIGDGALMYRSILKELYLENKNSQLQVFKQEIEVGKNIITYFEEQLYSSINSIHIDSH